MLLDQDGDLLERTYAEFITNSLSGYKKIWAEFIGNNGSNRPAAVPGVELTAVEERNRVRTGQHIYTLLEGVLCLQRLVSREITMSVNEPAAVLDVADFMLLFHAHLGRIRDQITKLGQIWDLPDLASKLEDCYQKRNCVLHGPKVPFSVEEGLAITAVPAGAADAVGSWDDKHAVWSDFDPGGGQYLEEYIRTSFNQALVRVNDALERAYSENIKPHLKDKSFPRLERPSSGSEPPASGTLGAGSDA